ncbi:GAF domain-containing protein [uncultured Acetobacteroides sp.]|uniref:GAF domain-containing protein n=1 Tax=uncultured Acetobacteroides sp. TaxID=1760811 RepID=UPI0029F51697|nr:GAF domain-containing protein [uncultured Acetobacteroides sp.]
MKIAANILVAGLLLFGFAAFAFIQNSMLEGTTPWYGYICLALSLLSGTILFALLQFQKDQIRKLIERVDTLSNSLNINTKQSETVNKEESNIASTKEVAQKIAQTLNLEDGIEAAAEEILIKLAKEVSFAHGLLYIADNQNKGYFKPTSKYAYYSEREPEGFKIGEGINGQAAKDQQPLLLESIPENYVTVVSGLGKSSPRALSIYPIVHNSKTVALLELAFLAKPSNKKIEIIGIFCDVIGEKVSLKQLV